MINYKRLLFILPLFALIQCSQSKTENLDKNIETESLDEISQAEEVLLAPVKSLKGWFFINESNEKPFDQIYKYAGEFSQGISCVKVDKYKFPEHKSNGKYFAINKNGETIENIVSDLPFEFTEGRAFIYLDGNSFLIDKTGKVLKKVPGEIHSEGYSDGIAVVYLENKSKEFWNLKGEVILNHIDMPVSSCSEGLMIFKNGEKYGYLDKNGEIAQEAIYNDASIFTNGFAFIEDNGYYLINKNFKKVIGPYQYIQDYSEDLVVIEEDNKSYYVDTEGKEVFDEKFSFALGFHDGVAIVTKIDYDFGLLNKDGEYTPLPPDFEQPKNFQNNLAILKWGGQVGFINPKGEWVIPTDYWDAKNFN